MAQSPSLPDSIDPSSPVPQSTGHLQTITYAPSSIEITDQLHGQTYTITEPPLLALLRSSTLLRLFSVGQHGITSLFELTPLVTRLEHSIGAMLLVRHVGGSVAEQASALLHDISHTVLSHVVDWAMCERGESYHEVHKDRFVATTDLPALLSQYGLGDERDGGSVLHEERFPLVERDSPRLCADRLDYGLRDSVAFGKLSISGAQSVVASLRAFPDTTSPERALVIDNPEAALLLARAYLASDRDIWSNPAHVRMARRAGTLIGDVVQSGRLDDSVLWTMSDKEFWVALRGAANEEERVVMDEIEGNASLKCPGAIPKQTKVRTIDPDVLDQDGTGIKTLSEVSPVYKKEREEYLASKDRLKQAAERGEEVNGTEVVGA